MLATFILYNTVLLASTAFLYHSEQLSSRLESAWWRFAGFLVVALPAAFRYNIGYDYMAYTRAYAANIDRSSFSFLFNEQIHLLNALGLDSQWLFITMAVLIYGLLFLIYPRRGGWVIHFFFMTTLYFQSFSVMRSTMATVLVLYALLEFMKHRSVWRYVLTVLASALLFHHTALLFLAVLLFELKPLKLLLTRHPAWPILVLILTFTFKHEIFWWLFNLPLVDYLGFGSYRHAPQFFHSVQLNTGLGVLLYFLLLMPPLLLADRIMVQNPRLYPVISMSFLCALALIFSLEVFIAQRVYIAYSVAYLLIVYAAMQLHFPHKTLFCAGMLLLSLLSFEKSIYRNSSDQCESLRVSPYVSVFNKADDHSYPIQLCPLK